MDRDGTLKIDYGEWRDYLLLSPSSNFNDILHYWRHSTVSMAKHSVYQRITYGGGWGRVLSASLFNST